MNLTLQIDGGSRGNPGPASAAVVLTETDSRRVVHEAGYYLGRATNNVAEYSALLRGLDVAVRVGAKVLHIRSDSELMVRQLEGQYRVKSPDLKPLFEQAQSLMRRLGQVHVQHVYRDKNKRADELANMAMDAKRDVIVVSGLDAPRPAEDPPGPASGQPSTSAPAPDAPTDPILSRWTAELLRSPGPRCPAACSPGKLYAFGPDTPAGFCVHAAAAALSLGPLAWKPGQDNRDQFPCPRCGVTIRIRLPD